MLRVGINPWPGYETLFLARELGRFDESAIRLVEMPSALQSMHALRSGTIEAAALTLDETLTLLREGVDLRVILVMDISRGGDAVLARPGIRRLADLKGKTVAVENTATGGILLEGALDAAGLKATDIRLKSLSANEQADAFVRGEVDAAVVYEPSKSRLLARGASVLFDSRQIPDRIMDVLVVKGTVIESQAANLKALLEGQFFALSRLAEQPLESARLMAPRLGVDPATLLASYRGLHTPDLGENRRWLAERPAALDVLARQLAEYMYSKGLLVEVPHPHRLSDPRFLPEEGS